MTIWRTESTVIQELGQTHKRRPSGQRLKRGYAVRSIDAIAHSDQLPLRQAHAPNATGPNRTGPTPPPSRPWAIPESAGTLFLIYPWRVLGSPWLYPRNQLRSSGDTRAAKTFKGSRWALIKNPQDLTGRQRTTLAGIAKTNGRLNRAATDSTLQKR